jgi:hypothetical protein
MLFRLILACLFVIPVTVMADANQGEFMGYRLGDDYTGTVSQPQITTSGNLILVADKPVKPDDITEVTLITTPESKTIGYINASSWFESTDAARDFGRKYVELLRAKYPDWKFGRERMDSNSRIVEVNFDGAPYNLQLRLNEVRYEDKMMWRLSMSLNWMPTAKEAQAWRNMSMTQQVIAGEDGRQQLLENADTRGL